MAGPLQGLKVLEVACIGPGPFRAMMLADMGRIYCVLTGTTASARIATGAIS